MMLTDFRCLWVIAVLILAPASALGNDPAPKPKPRRILDELAPGKTVPLPEVIATGVDTLERVIEQNQANQDKLKAGQMKQEDYDKSVVEIKQKVEDVAAKNPESAPVQTSAARADIQVGDTAKAVEHATQAMSLAPTNPFPVTTRSLAYYKAKDYPKAAEDAKKALEIDPNNSAARALYLLSKDRAPGGTIIDAALPRVRRVMETMTLPENPLLAKPELRPDDDPEIARYKTEAGRNYVRQIIAAESALKRKDYLTAYGAANAAMTTYADNPRIMATRAVAAFGLQDFKTAVSDATLVLKAHPTMHSMLTTRAAALNEMNRHAEALEDAQKAIALAPTEGRPYLERAIAREGLNDAAAGVLDDYKHAAEMDPQFTSDYYQALSRLKPEQSGQAGETVRGGPAGSVKSAATASNSLDGLMDRARGLEPMHMYAFAGLAVLAAASLVLMRRS